MSEKQQAEQKELEMRYGPAIAQFICDELKVTERMEEKAKERKLFSGYGDNTIIYRAAA